MLGLIAGKGDKMYPLVKLALMCTCNLFTRNRVSYIDNGKGQQIDPLPREVLFAAPTTHLLHCYMTWYLYMMQLSKLT